MSEDQVRAIVRDEVGKMVQEMTRGLIASGLLHKLAEQQGNN